MALTALVLVGHSLWPSGNGASSGAAASPQAVAVAAQENEPAAETVRLSVRDALKALKIPATGPRDPFALRIRTEATVVAQEKAVAPDSVDTVHLSALWTQGGTTFSLINDRICSAGDEIGRLKIESATQEGVWVTHWKGRDFIALGGDFTLKTPSDKNQGAAVSTL